MDGLSQKERVNVRRAFEAFDIDRSGSIELAELLAVFKILGLHALNSAEISEKFKQADKDGSGSITLAEFAEFFCAIRQNLSCNDSQAEEIMKKKPFERGSDDIVRLRSYLASTQPFFQRFSRVVLEELCRYISFEEVSAGTWLWRQGDKADRTCVVLSGSASVWTKPCIPTTAQHSAATVSSSPSTPKSTRVISRHISKRIQHEVEAEATFSSTTSENSAEDGHMDIQHTPSSMRGSPHPPSPWKSMSERVRRGGGAYGDTLEQSSLAISNRAETSNHSTSRGLRSPGASSAKSSMFHSPSHQAFRSNVSPSTHPKSQEGHHQGSSSRAMGHAHLNLQEASHSLRSVTTQQQPSSHHQPHSNAIPVAESMDGPKSRSSSPHRFKLEDNPRLRVIIPHPLETFHPSPQGSPAVPWGASSSSPKRKGSSRWADTAPAAFPTGAMDTGNLHLSLSICQSPLHSPERSRSSSPNKALSIPNSPIKAEAGLSPRLSPRQRNLTSPRSPRVKVSSPRKLDDKVALPKKEDGLEEEVRPSQEEEEEVNNGGQCSADGRDLGGVTLEAELRNHFEEDILTSSGKLGQDHSSSTDPGSSAGNDMSRQDMQVNSATEGLGSTPLDTESKPAVKKSIFASKFKKAVNSISLGIKVSSAIHESRSTPVLGDATSHQKLIAAGEVSSLGSQNMAMQVWSELVADMASGLTDQAKTLRGRPVFQGMVGSADVLAEALLVGSPEGGVVDVAVALAIGTASPPLREHTPWPPKERGTSIRAATSMKIISINPEAYRRIVVQSEAKSFYRSDYLLGLVSFPPGQRSGPQLATLVKYLGCLPSFKEAPLSLRLELSGSLQPTRCAPGSELAAAGEPVNAMHIIVEGSVGVFTKRSTQEDPGRSFKSSGFESMKMRAASADTFSGKAAHIRSKQHLNSKVSALSAEPNPVPTIREEGSSCKTSEDGLDREQEVEEAEEAEEDPVGVELITSDHIRSAVIMGNLIEGRDMDEGTECMTGGGIFSGGHIQQELLEAMFGRLKQQLRPGQTVSEHALLEALEGQSDDGACEATSSITAVAVEPTALLTVSREAYNSCLQAFHSEQSKQQLAFFESISIFRGVKKQTLQVMNSAVKWLTVPRGTLLQQAGAPMHGLYFIKEGCVAVMALPKASPDRPQAATNRPLSRPMVQVTLLGPSDFFGEDSFTTRNGVHAVSCIAETTCLVGWLRPADLRLIDRPTLSALLESSQTRGVFRSNRLQSAASKWDVSGRLRSANKAAQSADDPLDHGRSELHNDDEVKRRPLVSGETWDMSIYESWLAPARKLIHLEEQDAVEIAAMFDGLSAISNGLGVRGIEAGLDRLQLRELIKEAQQMEAERLEEEAAELIRQAKEQEQRRQAAASVAGIVVIPENPATSKRASRSSQAGSVTPRSATSTPRGSANVTPRAGEAGAAVPVLSRAILSKLSLEPTDINAPTCFPVSRQHERPVPADHTSMPSILSSLLQSRSLSTMPSSEEGYQTSSDQVPGKMGQTAVLNERQPDGLNSPSVPSSLGRDSVPRLALPPQLTGSSTLTLPKLPILRHSSTSHAHADTQSSPAKGNASDGIIGGDMNPPPPRNGLAKGMGKFRYRGWKPSAAASHNGALSHENESRPPLSGSSFGDPSGHLSNHMTSSTSALNIADVFIPGLKAFTFEHHGDDHCTQSGVRVLALIGGGPTNVSGNTVLSTATRRSPVPNSLLSDQRVRMAQAGRPIKLPHAAPSGSLAVGMHYSAADVTSYRWKEINNTPPQQAAFLNRVELLKIGLENAMLDMQQGGGWG